VVGDSLGMKRASRPVYNDRFAVCAVSQSLEAMKTAPATYGWFRDGHLPAPSSPEKGSKLAFRINLKNALSYQSIDVDCSRLLEVLEHFCNIRKPNSVSLAEQGMVLVNNCFKKMTKKL
jgi:hypothetical protein